MAGITPVANYAQSNFTADTATTYKTKIDSNAIAAQRVADNFAAHQLATAAMKVVLEPGHIFAGTTLTEVGAQTTLTTTSGSASATVASATGIANGMAVSAAGVPNNATATISGTTVTLSAAATASATVAATFMQVTGTITAPGGNPRIDRVVIDRFTGSLSVLTGTPAAAPVPPAVTTGNVPVCQILLQTGSTAITNSMLTDERDFSALGHGTAGELNVGTGPNNIVQLDGSSKLPAVDGSQLTGIATAAPVLRKQVFTSAGAFTFTTPSASKVTTVYKVTLTAAGGSGCGGLSGAGAGAGETAIKWVTGLSPSTGYRGSVGTGATGGSGTGSAGGNTTMTDATPTTYTANGGGAAGNTTANGTGGSGGNGDVNIPGGDGGTGAGTAAVDVGGYGGGSFWGSGGAQQFNSNISANGTCPGAGGSGHSNSAGNGGNGANGICVIEWVL